MVADGEFIPCDAVISTVEPRVLDILTKGKLGALHETLRSIRYQGTACALIGLKKRLMEDGNYWLNIKADVPFGAVIEHTNFMPFEDYGEHLLYVTSYFQNENDALWVKKEEEVLDAYLKGLERMFPDFKRTDIKWAKIFRRMDTAPVYEQGYLPERSLNGSVKAGLEAANFFTKKDKKCEVCWLD